MPEAMTRPPEHQRLHRLLIDRENRPCARCQSMGERDVHRLVPRLGYVADNVQILCVDCHRDTHYQGKFVAGDRVYLNGRTPSYLELARHRPRTIVAVEYSPQLQANLYTLGSNGRGACSGENASDGYAAYQFRSYQIHPWVVRGQTGRPKRVKRAYQRKGVESYGQPASAALAEVTRLSLVNA